MSMSRGELSAMKNEKVYEQIGVAMTCRSFAEYRQMFDLSESVLAKGAILDVAAGASSFTAEANALGYKAVAADPLYTLGPEQIQSHGLQEIQQSTEKIAKVADRFIWDYYGSLDNHRMNRERSLKIFTADYERFAQSDRYLYGKLPELPFSDDSFSLVLCSHFLFLYAEQFGYDFHKRAVNELIRVCGKGGEVQIYPLLSLQWKSYEHLERLMSELSEMGVGLDMCESRLPFIPGSTKLLRISK
jgi:hypothetical protein